MAELKQCEFLLLRYVPDAVKDEFVNIGVLVLDGSGFAEMRFTRDWSRVRCLDPAADVEMLEALENDVRNRLRIGGEQRELILKRLEDSFSNVVQLSGAKACLTESPQAELRKLAKMYLETGPRDRPARGAGARQRITAQMRDAFTQAGVWDLMWKRVPAAKYGHKGDPLKIDCGYKPNGVVRFFHGLALQADVEPAKSLAFSYPAVRDGIARSLNAKTDLAAIVDTTDRADEEVAFALDVLQQGGIRVVPIGEIGGIAEAARGELLK